MLFMHFGALFCGCFMILLVVVPILVLNMKPTSCAQSGHQALGTKFHEECDMSFGPMNLIVFLPKKVSGKLKYSS